MREFRLLGSVRGACSNACPYRDHRPLVHFQLPTGGSLCVPAEAEKGLREVPERDANAIVRDFSTLASDPYSRAVDDKKLQPKSSGEFRLWVGRWRASFILDRATSTIQVLRVDDRRDAY